MQNVLIKKKEERERERVEKYDDDDVERARLSCRRVTRWCQSPKQHQSFATQQRAMIFSGEFQKKNKTLNSTYNRV